MSYGGPGDPPPPDWELDANGNPSQFDLAQSLAQNGYDSTNSSFKDANGNAYYLFAGIATTSGRVAWYTRKLADANNAPQALIPSATFDAIKNGTLNKQTGELTYNGTTYKVVIRNNGTGKNEAHLRANT